MMVPRSPSVNARSQRVLVQAHLAGLAVVLHLRPASQLPGVRAGEYPDAPDYLGGIGSVLHSHTSWIVPLFQRTRWATNSVFRCRQCPRSLPPADRTND